ncbi:MAG: SpoIID/LytB domain-containing protein [Myxococcaceae bacterium]|nr:SpoIID/LytB domain-containing protein [Myxococcaceae bacterium]
MRVAVVLLFGVWARVAFGAETMRIAIGPEVASVAVQGSGLACGDDVDEADFVSLGREALVIRRRGDALTLDDAPLPAGAIRCRAAKSAALSVNGVKVQGDVVVVNGRLQLVAVNVLPLEAYLAGVLGSEMPKTFPLEALKAQAVAARTYALNKKLEQYGQPFHLGSSVISQVYRGLEADDPRTRQAIEETRGLVLTWQLQPIEAYFHASCGGRTESGLEALGRDLPYLKSVSCPCARLPTSHWTLKVAPKELAPVAGGKASGLQVQGRSATGRARRVQVGARSIDAVSFRERLGYMRLKSLDFEVERHGGDGWVLKGHGFGHGAGLCQWGSRLLADAGRDFAGILQHYYPGTELQQLYE